MLFTLTHCRLKLWNSVWAQGVFFCLCHLAWAPTLVTPDRLLPYLDVKMTRLYPLVSIKFLLISWQLQDYIKTNCWNMARCQVLSLFHFLYSWPACSPFHLPPTSLSRPASLWLLGSLMSYLFLMNPTLTFGISCFAWVVCVPVNGNRRKWRTDRQMDRWTDRQVCISVVHVSVCLPGQKHRLSLQEVCTSFPVTSSQNITWVRSSTWSPTENPLNYVSAFLSLSWSLPC